MKRWAGPRRAAAGRNHGGSHHISPYAGASNASASIAGNELVVVFTPGLENARTYRINLNGEVTSIPGQFVEVSGLLGDVIAASW
jgi:hypothetical protein